MKSVVTTALFVSVAAALATATPTLAAPATAPTSMQQRVNTALIETPGGIQTAWNEISWDNGDVVLTIAPEGLITASTVGTCESGKFCAYAKASYSGTKLTFSTCTSGLSVTALPQVRSIANARSSGTVTAYNGSTLVTTVAAGTGKNTTGTITSLSCS